MTESQRNLTEEEKTAALHDIAEEVEEERQQRGHSDLDGENIVDNSPADSEGDDEATLAGDVEAIPPVRPGGS